MDGNGQEVFHNLAASKRRLAHPESIKAELELDFTILTNRQGGGASGAAVAESN